MSRKKLESIVKYKKCTKRNDNENYKNKELYYTINMKICFGYTHTHTHKHTRTHTHTLLITNQSSNFPLDCKGI